jgi:hypothetical protein
LPNASRIQEWLVKIQTHSPVWRGIFSPFTDTFYIFGHLLSENTELLANLASVFKNLSTPLKHMKKKNYCIAEASAVTTLQIVYKLKK